ncbi:replication initiator [Pedococcus cremeus]|uniref:replication initiator n=1 Tax=Pedococcus cremeus TaxID=587636 RepID=UPI000B320DD8|nr:replication initiator [Pedococcus cremeus]
MHGDDDPGVGQPLCPDCYDYAAQVVWQWWAPELWRRFTIALYLHHLGTPADRAGLERLNARGHAGGTRKEAGSE